MRAAFERVWTERGPRCEEGGKLGPLSTNMLAELERIWLDLGQPRAVFGQTRAGFGQLLAMSGPRRGGMIAQEGLLCSENVARSPPSYCLLFSLSPTFLLRLHITVGPCQGRGALGSLACLRADDRARHRAWPACPKSGARVVPSLGRRDLRSWFGGQRQVAPPAQNSAAKPAPHQPKCVPAEHSTSSVAEPPERAVHASEDFPRSGLRAGGPHLWEAQTPQGTQPPLPSKWHACPLRAPGARCPTRSARSARRAEVAARLRRAAEWRQLRARASRHVGW